jgi:UDP-MurNAc hydroxylase
MKVTYIADSTFLFEHRGIRLLTDPWIGSTIYGGAWVQYPPPGMKASEIGRLDYIFISHIHEDHCDPATIAQLDRNATVLLMDRTPDFVEGFLKRHGFGFREIRKIPTFTQLPIGEGLVAETVEADPEHKLNWMIDSALLLHADGRSLYFANDNPPYPRCVGRLKELDLALALLPASGGSGYPACFASLSEPEQAAERERIVAMYFDVFADALVDTLPERFMACAGNHVLSGRHAMLNRMMTFLASPAGAYRHTHQRLPAAARTTTLPLDLEEGQSWEMPARREVRADAAAVWAEAMDDRGRTEARAAFIAGPAAAQLYTHDAIEVPPGTDWVALFRTGAEAMLDRVRASSIPVASRIAVRLPGPDERWGVADAMAGSVTTLEGRKPDEPYLAIETDAPLLWQLLTGKFSWNIADAAAFLTYHRVPNVYDQHAVIALNYLRQPPRGPAAPDPGLGIQP